VVALLDDAVLPVTVAGVSAGRVTFGHRFLHPAAITLGSASDYGPALLAASVIADVGARREAVRREVARAASAAGARAVIDEATLETVVHLVERPVGLIGTFAESYLDLPRAVVETPIRRHQKSFTLERGDGRLAPFFAAVSNTPGADPVEVRRGNERVIRARLADAAFYFREDLKLRPEDRLTQLKGMVFQEQLGNLFEKTERVVALAEFLAAAADVDVLRRAGLLAKTDLASGMVREFPELQGIIGEEYARRAGETSAVARAIREHYLPRGADDDLPASVEGAILSIADKTDTVVGCIGVGLTPSGSQDPYGLRRQSQAIVTIALAQGFAISLSRLVDRALDLLAAKLSEPAAPTRERVLDLLRARLATALGSRGLRADVVEAVLSSGFDDPAQALKRAAALTTLMHRPDWEPLVVTFKRAINILPARPIGPVTPSLFVDDAERALHAQTTEAMPRIRRALAADDYAGALTETATLRPAVDRFFEAVMVMDQDRATQDNRLALLKALGDVLLPIADLRKVHSAS
jgi:glycyl-tRNA synthetase beta chain